MNLTVHGSTILAIAENPQEAAAFAAWVRSALRRRAARRGQRLRGRSDAQVIRGLAELGYRPRAIARRYEISERMVWRIVSGKAWQ